MKKDIRADSAADGKNKEFDLELDSANDIIKRIEGLSYEGRRHIIAYLKAKVAKSKKEREQNSD